MTRKYLKLEQRCDILGKKQRYSLAKAKIPPHHAALMKELSAHYISGTHWDREWYRPFQEYRFLLVKLLDDLLDLMEQDTDFRYFQLDGQTCLIEDYLEIRPENRDRLGQLIQSGRILIGPWFTMPDLFCVGDETIIRNLLLGKRIAREWGVAPMPVGFVCDMFGHPAQIPQILKGFGYKDCVLGRGTNESTTPPFFNWCSPDGSEVFTFKLQDSQGYGAFALPRAALEEGDSFVHSTMGDFLRDMEEAGDDKEKRREVREKHFRIELAKYVNHEIGRAEGIGPLCLMDSMDHIPPASDVAGYLRLIREACPEVTPAHSNLPAFFEEARKEGRASVTRTGELREPSRTKNSYLWLIPNCPSARIRIKMANDECRTLLERWADPLVALANLHGAGIPVTHLLTAWKNLLLNHAHDSICGCSIDQVHRDMMYRFDQAMVLGEQLRAQAFGHLTASCADLARGEDEFTVTVFNPVPQSREEVVIFPIDLPPDYPTEFRESFFSQALKSFILEDEEGNEIPYQRLSFIPKTNERSRFAKFCFQSDGPFARYVVAARLSLPGLGFTSLRVRPSDMPVRVVGSLRTGPVSAANEFFGIAIQPNGTLMITDRVTGETYNDLLTFEHRSEVADGWFHAHSLNDEQILSSASSAQVSVVHDGPEVVTFRSTVTLSVPLRHDDGTERPVSERVVLPITSLISLRRGARVVEVETTVENTAEDHRIRMLLPTDCPDAPTYLSQQPFDFVERPIAIDASTANWQEMEQVEKPFMEIQAVGNGQRGLAVLSAAGPHEGGVADDARRTMLVTLLRSFRRTITTGGEPDGLEKGSTTFRFALMPFVKELPRAEALWELARLQGGLITRQTGKRPSGFPAMAGKLSATCGFMECLSGNLIPSAIKTPEQGEGLVLRFWNPTDKPQTEKIRFWREIISVEELDLAEEVVAATEVVVKNGVLLQLNAAPHRIVTLRVTLSRTP